jgi:cyclophilin family peptidyl-prolyl cis-trans isomerase
MDENLPADNSNTYLIIGSVLVLIVVVVSYFVFSTDNAKNQVSSEPSKVSGQKLDVSATPQPKTETSPKEGVGMTVEQKSKFQEPPMMIDTNKKYMALMKTSVGDISIELSAKSTPITANNFIALAKSGFYKDVIFHRVMKGFMIQGGDPTGTGMGGPDYRFDDEPFDGKYTRGTIAMANAGPNTNGSQFFIMHADYPLPKSYVIFGRVTKGLEIVDKIAEALTKTGLSGEMSTPIDPVKILSVDIVEN